MKTLEQIEMAKELIKGLQDYIELAKVEKKLKVEVNRKSTCKMIENIVEDTKAISNEL